jgi:hypothetical protein
MLQNENPVLQKNLLQWLENFRQPEMPLYF